MNETNCPKNYWSHIDRTTFYVLDWKRNEFYFNFTMDENNGKKNLQFFSFFMKKESASYIFSYFRTGEYFLSEARKHINERRLDRATEETRFIPGKTVGVWSGREDELKMDQIKSKINLRIAGLYKYPKTDTEFMTAWLRRSKQDCLVDSGFIELDKLLPAGAPVIDFLRVDSERPDGWAHPSLKYLDGWRSNRGIPTDYPCTLDVREVIMGRSTDAEWLEFNKWVRDRWAEDQKVFPSRVLSFDTEQCFITNLDWIYMGKKDASDVVFQ
ncbi:MAG: hypothetical protein AAFO91_19790, partial [Bacteroidota bacterium]